MATGHAIYRSRHAGLPLLFVRNDGPWLPAFATFAPFRLTKIVAINDAFRPLPTSDTL